ERPSGRQMGVYAKPPVPATPLGPLVTPLLPPAPLLSLLTQHPLPALLFQWAPPLFLVPPLILPPPVMQPFQRRRPVPKTPHVQSPLLRKQRQVFMGYAEFL